LTLSIEEAVQRVKAEIIAPDWRLSSKRIEALNASFACLRERYQDSKDIKAILTMAGNVLQYIRSKGDYSPPDSIDFLKEAMADIVSLYEEGDHDPEREERVFKKIFARFQVLKEKIKAHKASRPKAVIPPENCFAGGPAESPAIPPKNLEVSRSFEREIQYPWPASAEPAEMGPLLAELQDSLQRAEKVGAALRKILQAPQAVAELPGTPRGGPMRGPLPGEITPDNPAEGGPVPEASVRKPYQQPVRECTPTLLREISIGGHSLGVPEENIALVKPLSAAAREKYLRGGQVLLGDFHRLFSGLGRQFRGTLATLNDRKLRKMILPVMDLQGFGYPELPDEQAAALLVLSHGNWHGVLLCAETRGESCLMVKFRRSPNGDIDGIGYLEDDRELPVVNLVDLLRREGFLLV
jgi:hypothetical protein